MSTKNATIEVICYKYKPLKNNELPIKLRITKSRKRTYLNVGISVKPEHWDFEKNKPKRNCPNREQVLNIISDKTKEIESKSLNINYSRKTLQQSHYWRKLIIL